MNTRTPESMPSEVAASGALLDPATLRRRRWWLAATTTFRNATTPIRRKRRWKSPLLRALGEHLEDRLALSVTAIQELAPIAITSDVGHKPQSKVWEHTGVWWSVLSDSRSTWLNRLDGTTWTPTLELSTRSALRADVLPDGDVTHVLLHKSSATQIPAQLVSVEYISSSPGGYQFWRDRPHTVNVPIPVGVETATIDRDSTGRMWTTYESGLNIEVLYSDAPYDVWSGPIVLAEGVDDDDIAVVTALPGKIGVLWSNQATQRFGFRTHVDGDDPGVWTADEVPAAESALNVRRGMADDHLNVAVAADGSLYAAVKTGYDTSGYPAIALLARRPDGNWDPLHAVDDVGTRPIVQLNEMANTLLVSYRSTDDLGPIVYKECSAVTIACGPRNTLIDDLDARDVTGPKHNITDDVVILASKSGAALGVRALLGTPQNQAPTVDAGADQTVALDSGAVLAGSVGDDGLPNPPGALATAWSLVTGPGTVTFADSASPETTATFSAAGEYVLRLTADDGEFSSFDDVVITVTATALPVTVAFQDGVAPDSAYLGTRDATIQAKSPDINFGGEATLLVDGSPDLGTLLMWDLSSIPAGSIAQSASITLNVTDRTNDDYQLYQILREWDEQQTTWTGPLTGQPWQIGGADGPSDRGDQVLGQAGPASKGSHVIELNAEGMAVVQSWLDSPAANQGLLLKDYVGASDGMDFSSREAADPALRPRLTVTYRPSASQPQNQPPTVDAGADQMIFLSDAVLLDGTVSDDGLPQPPGAVTTTWSMVSGPGTVAFDQPHAIDTSATFSAAGVYVLRLTAHDSELTGNDEVAVTVSESGGGEPVTISFQDGVAPDSTYGGTRDARLESSDPDLNFGDASLQADGTPDTSSLLQWDVTAIPAGSQVQSASITLNVINASIHDYEFYRVLRPWMEQEATWVQFAAGNLWQNAGAMGADDAATTVLGTVAPLATGAITIDLNAAGVQVVQAWVNDPDANFGLLLQDYVGAADMAGFTAREGNVPPKRPRLSITYLPPAAAFAATSEVLSGAALASHGSLEAATHEVPYVLIATTSHDAEHPQPTSRDQDFNNQAPKAYILLPRQVDSIFAASESERLLGTGARAKQDPDQSDEFWPHQGGPHERD